jgi:hypothetical protein
VKRACKNMRHQDLHHLLRSWRPELHAQTNDGA